MDGFYVAKLKKFANGAKSGSDQPEMKPVPNE